MNKIWKYDQGSIGNNDNRRNGLQVNKTSYGGFKLSDNSFHFANNSNAQKQLGSN